MTIFDKLFTKHSVRHSLPSGLRQTEFSVEMRNPPTHINFICQVFILTVSVFLHLPEAYQLSSLVLPFMRWLPFYRKKRETVRRKFVQPLPPDPFTFQIFPSYPLPPVVAEEIPSSNPRFIPLPILWIPTPPIMRESRSYLLSPIYSATPQLTLPFKE